MALGHWSGYRPRTWFATLPTQGFKVERLTDETRAEAGGRFSVGKLRVLEWLTPNFENDFEPVKARAMWSRCFSFSNH